MQKTNNEIKVKTFKEFKQKLKEIIQDKQLVECCLKDNGLYIKVK